MIRAKFYVRTITKHAYFTKQYADSYAKPIPAGDVFLAPVSGRDGNEEWASATPAGEIKLTTHGPAFEQFEANLGAECYVTFDFAQAAADSSAATG